MDKTAFNLALPSGERQHNNVPAGDANSFHRGGPGPYLVPPSAQPDRDSSRDTLHSNMTSANSGAFWPVVQNPPQYLPPLTHQPPSSDQRCPPWPAAPAPGYGAQPYGYGPPLPQPPPRFDGYGPPGLPRGFGFDPSVPPPALSSYPGRPQFPPMMMSEAQRPSQRGPAQADPSLGGPGRSWAGDPQPGLGGPGVQQTVYPPTAPQLSQYGRQPSSNPDSSFRAEYPERGFPEERRPLLSTPSIAPRDPEFRGRGDPEFRGRGEAVNAPPPDEHTLQRTQDEQWLQRFLQSRSRVKLTLTQTQTQTQAQTQTQTQTLTQTLTQTQTQTQTPGPEQTGSAQSVAHVRDALYSAVKLVSQLSAACDALRDNLENESAWAEAYTHAASVKKDLQERLEILSDPACVEAMKKKCDSVRKRRSRKRLNKLARIEEKCLEEERIAEREAAIDKWRMKRVHEVEEKKRERELKMAADSVLSEVRKKQADVRRMLDILRSLEKLRKLRKEAASRKGIFPAAASDAVFEGQVERLRGLIRTRTAVYGAEENALRVMLEGEQEEERRRDREKRQRKERDKLLQKKRRMEIMLFGDEMPPDHPLQPFREYYTQAERSLPALIQIRREWDMCLVPENYPDGTSVPLSWVLPEAPSDQGWASALDRD